jgi:glucokinase
MTPSGKISLGLDVGGTEIKAIAFEATGNILSTFDVPSNAKHGPEAVKKTILECVQYFRDQSIPFTTVGIGCAGAVTPKTGIVLNSPNFSNWKNVPLQDWIESAIQCPVRVNNDANCAAFAEWKLGNGVGTTNMILLTFGTGVGGGLILNNKLFTGSGGGAGELGHFSIHANGIQCQCGNTGCFERYCSASALQIKIPGHSAKEIFENADHSPFKEAVAEFLWNTKVGLTSFANLFDPDCILLGGAVAKGLAQYLIEIQQWIKKHAFPAVSNNLRLELAKFGNQSGAMGAALLSNQKN